MSGMNTKKLGLIVLFFLFFFFLLSSPSFPHGNPAAQEDITLTAELKSDVVNGVNKILVNNYIFPDTAKEMAEYTSTQHKEGKYDSIDDVNRFARVLTQDLRSISKDKHIRVTYSPETVRRIRTRNSKSPEDRERERKERLERERRRNFGFKKLEILEGNIGYLDLRGFSGANEASETIISAMNFLANADAVIIDLRNNGGGNPFTIQIISSYFLREYTHLNSFEWRGEDTIRQFWTLRYVPGKKMYDTDLYILTSSRTFSAAEEFTYNLKNLKRATIVGETTGGGAHPGGSRIVNDYFLVWVPSGRAINPITKTNWEGKGIEPHISVARDKALDKAHYTALEKLLEKTDAETRKRSLQWAMEGIKAKSEPIQVEEEILQKYVGKYTRGDIVLEKGMLFFKDGPQRMKLIPLSETYFIIEGENNIRAEFILDDQSKEYKIKAHFSDGKSEIVNRLKKEK
ncbi:MAG: S41 family peptidase [Candidatus Aminicenantes bacterium]|jgi:C-terminal processing protease CtpA/Prc